MQRKNFLVLTAKTEQRNNEQNKHLTSYKQTINKYPKIDPAI